MNQRPLSDLDKSTGSVGEISFVFPESISDGANARSRMVQECFQFGIFHFETPHPKSDSWRYTRQNGDADDVKWHLRHQWNESADNSDCDKKPADEVEYKPFHDDGCAKCITTN